MMKQWKIQYSVMVGTQEDPDWDGERGETNKGRSLLRNRSTRF